MSVYMEVQPLILQKRVEEMTKLNPVESPSTAESQVIIETQSTEPQTVTESVSPDPQPQVAV